MKKYIISRLSSSGQRQYLKRVTPSVWSNYECDAISLSEIRAKLVQRFLLGLSFHCPIEVKEYHPPKLP